MLNRTTIIGRLTRDPDVKYTPSGKAVATLGIAVDGYGRDAETNFFNVVAWEKTAEFVAQYIGKGRLVAIDGRLQSRSWKADDGSKRSIVEIVAQDISPLDKPRHEAIADDPNFTPSREKDDPFADE